MRDEGEKREKNKKNQRRGEKKEEEEEEETDENDEEKRQEEAKEDEDERKKKTKKTKGKENPPQKKRTKKKGGTVHFVGHQRLHGRRRHQLGGPARHLGHRPLVHQVPEGETERPLGGLEFSQRPSKTTQIHCFTFWCG